MHGHLAERNDDSVFLRDPAEFLARSVIENAALLKLLGVREVIALGFILEGLR
jgi:hypothetical protein